MRSLADKAPGHFGIRSTRADIGYDDKKAKKELREGGTRPRIKHRLFYPMPTTWDLRRDTKECGRRSLSETANSIIKRKYGSCVASKMWNRQFKEVNLMAVMYDTDIGLRGQNK